MASTLDLIRRHVVSRTGLATYAVLDGGRIPGLLDVLDQMDPTRFSLWPQERDPRLQAVAPHLVLLDGEEPFVDWLLGEGWAQSWGIFAHSGAAIRAVRHHLRGLLRVLDPDLEPVHFRYYDPRVFRVFLPTCSEEQLDQFFGPIAMWTVESQDGQTVLHYERRGSGGGSATPDPSQQTPTKATAAANSLRVSSVQLHEPYSEIGRLDET